MFNNYRNLSTAIHQDGFVIILIAAVITLIAAATLGKTFGWIGTILTLWCIFFFRNPIRSVPQIDDVVLSPADGIVVDVSYSKLPEEIDSEEKDQMLKISIFLNIFNVHVNRVPSDGKIKKLHYHNGKFLNASLDKASKENERQTILMKTNSGKEIAFVQIAGLLAKRIVCDLEEDMDVKAGERFGIIKFSSRMDIYLPKEITPRVSVGQTMIGGETIIAYLNDASGKKINFKQI